jgi:hypothetical protein
LPPIPTGQVILGIRKLFPPIETRVFYTNPNARNVTGKERYSAPFFFEPNFTCVVECLPSCIAPGEKPKFPPTTSGSVYVCMCVCVARVDTAVCMVGSGVYVSFVRTCVRHTVVYTRSCVQTCLGICLRARSCICVCARACVGGAA